MSGLNSLDLILLSILLSCIAALFGLLSTSIRVVPVFYSIFRRTLYNLVVQVRVALMDYTCRIVPRIGFLVSVINATLEEKLESICVITRYSYPGAIRSLDNFEYCLTNHGTGVVYP